MERFDSYHQDNFNEELTQQQKLDDDNEEKIPGLKERNRDDSDSEDDSYQQDRRNEKSLYSYNNNARTQY